jgi:hypothetical protein
MKKTLFTLIILFQISSVFGQRINEFGLELGYPISVGEVSLNSLYKSEFDLGIQYNAFQKKNFVLGLALNVSKYSNKNLGIRLLSWVPQVELGYNIGIGKFTLTPNLSVGYVSWNFRLEVLGRDGSDIEEVMSIQANGFSASGGITCSLPITQNLAGNVQFDYDLLRFEQDESVFWRGDNRTRHTIYPRIGVTYTLESKK